MYVRQAAGNPFGNREVAAAGACPLTCGKAEKVSDLLLAAQELRWCR